MAVRLSATLIVKDEELCLADCLRSIKDLVDEILVVDTGSRDSSREIAQTFGAQVRTYHWQDDFAAARNYALDQASGDWILYIDADERVRPYDRRALEAELARPRLCGATVKFHARTGFTAYPEYRLFRRDPRIRFRGVIHETILPDLNRLTADDNELLGTTRLTIDHIGYDGDQSHKLERNLNLLTKQTRIDPERIYLWWHLGTVYRDLGKLEDADAAWSEGVNIARRSHVRGPDIALCFIELSKVWLLAGKNPLPLLEEASKLQPGNLLVDWLKARALVVAGRYNEAISLFTALAAIDASTLLDETAYDRRIFGAWSFAEAAYCAFKLNRFDESEKLYCRAQELEPQIPEFRIKRQLAAARANEYRGIGHHTKGT